MANDNEIENAILTELFEKEVVEDTGKLAETLGREHNEVVGFMKSLQAAEMILVQATDL